MTKPSETIGKLWRSRLWLPLLLISLIFNGYALRSAPEIDPSAEITLDSVRLEARESPIIQDILKSKFGNPIKRELIKEGIELGNIPKSMEINYELFIDMNPESCMEGKCLTYIMKSKKEGIEYIATTYVKKEQVGINGFIPSGSDVTISVNCDIIFKYVCIFNAESNKGLEGKYNG
ncbi:MAG: hypothetical protein C0605_11905 [Hyphomicrobiales bacterium]|nr:MAG: hypothetical protein C0605_11905 [Hyphomicrobiales bacterium]